MLDFEKSRHGCSACVQFTLDILVTVIGYKDFIMKNVIFYLSLVISTLVSFTITAEQETQQFSDAELAQMLAPIALYPDSLLTHILIASTYPIEIIEAHRWLKKNDNLNTDKKSQLLKSFDWDASVKALIPFDRVLSRLSADLSWTQALGDAFLQDESRLLLSIQTLRKQAKLAGSLNKMDNMDIRYEDSNILILPRKKEVVYVPYYDSRMVYGSWFWTAYPPVYWHSNRRADVSHYRPFHWNAGVHITFNYFFSAFHWHNRYVVVVAPHRAHFRNYSQRPRRLIVHGGYAKRWSHKPSHRKGVAYRTKKTSKKYYSNRVSSKRVGVHRANTAFNTKANTTHRNFKQRLQTTKHSDRKIKHKVKHDEMQSRPANKKYALHHKSRSTSTFNNKQSRRISDQKRKQQQFREKKSLNHKNSSTQRNHRNQSRER